MRFPILPVLGTFLSVAVFGPFALMFAGPALTGNSDAAQVGLYLLIHVNPVVIPVLLLLLGIAWALQAWTTPTPPAPSMPAPVVPATPATPAAPPRPLRRAYRPPTPSSAPRTVPPRDPVIDVVAVRVDARPVPRAHDPYRALGLQAAHRVCLPAPCRSR